MNNQPDIATASIEINEEKAKARVDIYWEKTCNNRVCLVADIFWKFLF